MIYSIRKVCHRDVVLADNSFCHSVFENPCQWTLYIGRYDVLSFVWELVYSCAKTSSS